VLLVTVETNVPPALLSGAVEPGNWRIMIDAIDDDVGISQDSDAEVEVTLVTESELTGGRGEVAHAEAVNTARRPRAANPTEAKSIRNFDWMIMRNSPNLPKIIFDSSTNEREWSRSSIAKTRGSGDASSGSSSP